MPSAAAPGVGPTPPALVEPGAASYLSTMPFDPATSPAPWAVPARDRAAVATWLLGLSAMVLVMVALGGATRLTGSGLSIMEWAPLSGTLPPLSHAAWAHLFGLYKTIPQYRLLNPDMTLAGFQHIFWLEWVHRLWGRLMGLALLLPLGWFWWRGAVTSWLLRRLLLLFALGGLQGAVGWFMVASGFAAGSTAVSAYRLVVHLALALILYSALLWTGLSVLRPMPAPVPPRGVVRALGILLGCLALTITAGGFVAGLHAGLIYNEFPLMGGRLLPEGYGALHPLLRNVTENIAAVQFDHRLLATVTALLLLATVAVGFASRPPRAVAQALAAICVLLLAQYALGVATLLSVVAIPIAVAHQVNAALLLGAALVTLHQLRGERV